MDNQHNLRSIVQQYEYTGNTINYKSQDVNETFIALVILKD